MEGTSRASEWFSNIADDFAGAEESSKSLLFFAGPGHLMQPRAPHLSSFRPLLSRTEGRRPSARPLYAWSSSATVRRSDGIMGGDQMMSRDELFAPHERPRRSAALGSAVMTCLSCTFSGKAPEGARRRNDTMTPDSAPSVGLALGEGLAHARSEGFRSSESGGLSNRTCGRSPESSKSPSP